MKAIRIVAVGLLAGSIILGYFAPAFFSFWLHLSSSQAFISAISALSPSVAGATGIGLVGIVVWSIFSIGAGLFLAACAYAKIESVVLMAFGRHVMANGKRIHEGERKLAHRKDAETKRVIDFAKADVPGFH